MKQPVIYCLLLAVLYACNTQTKSNSAEKDSTSTGIDSSFFEKRCTPKEEYPELIVEHELFNFYDSAKWLFYACNFECEFVPSDTYNGEAAPIKNFKLISHELDAGCIPEDSLIMVRFGAMRFHGKDCQTNSEANFVFSYDNNYLDNFSTTLGCDSVIYRNHDGFMFIPPLESYFRNPEKYSKRVKLLRRAGFKPIEEQLASFRNYLKTTNDTLTEWLQCEAEKRGVFN